MISFRYKTATRQVKIRTKKQLDERMSSWLQGIFGIKNPIVGFKVPGNKYYDTETFYSHKEKFYGQIVDIIESSDQLEISFISENLNSSSFIKPSQPFGENKQFLSEEYRGGDSEEENIKVINDLKTLQWKLQDNRNLAIFFDVHQIYKKQVSESAAYLKHQNGLFKVNLFMKIHTGSSVPQPKYSLYIGKKLILNLNMTREYKETIQMIIDRYSKRITKANDKGRYDNVKIFEKGQKFQKGQERDQVYRASNEQDNEAPSFTTYQLQERLNQQTCQDYLVRMFQDKLLKKYEYLKLSEKCDENFVDFYRIFCEGAIDNDYQNFRNQILMKVENNLQILLSKVNELDLSRPVSREEQRHHNLKKSVSNIQIVKVQNYFQILDQLKQYLSPKSINDIKTELLDQDQATFSLFSDFLSRKISKEQLATSLENLIDDSQAKRPVSRCLPRPINKIPFNQSDDMILISPIAQQPSQPIKLMNFGQNKNKEQGFKTEKREKNEPKQTPPMFGSSKNQNNFSPIKYMSDIESNYKQAWSRLENKGHLFQSEQYGLLYHYLHIRDDSISNFIQELEWNEQGSIDKLKQHLAQRVEEILKQNFSDYEIAIIQSCKSSPQFDCIYQNFKYQSDLNAFLQALKSEIAVVQSSPLTEKVLKKKKSDGHLLGSKQKQKSKRRYSDEQGIQANSSPKSSCNNSNNSLVSRAKTIEQSLNNVDIMNSFWKSQFEGLLRYCRLNEVYKEDYLRDAFKEGNPAVFGWIYKYKKNDMNERDIHQIKKDTRISENDYKLVSKMAPIFNELLTILIQEGVISQKIKQWCIASLIDVNIVVISIIECFIQTNDEEQFVQNLTLAFQLFNADVQFYQIYLNRIEKLLKQVSAYDEISMEIFRLYPKQMKAVCQLYYVTGNMEDLLETLDIMHCIEANKRKIKIATLNFSGINMNPFEYQDGSEQMKKINEIMKDILSNEEVKNYFKDSKLSKIDKKLTSNITTVSVRFGGTNFFDENDKLLTKDQYVTKWINQFEQKAPTELKQHQEITKQQIATFDYYCYISVISYLYEIKYNEDYEFDNLKDLDITVFKQFLFHVSDRPSSQVEIKQQLVVEYLLKNQIDIFFIQQAGQVDWGEQLIHSYHCVKMGDSVIIFRIDKIGKVKHNHELMKYAERLQFNNDTSFLFSDRGYLLISSHLTSKSHKVDQAKQAFKVLDELRKQHPLLKIIIGIDANHYLGEHGEQNFLDTVPRSSEETTSTKQRTYLQAQFKKSDQYTSAVKDHLLSNLKIKDYLIGAIDGTEAKERQLLPNRRHPYDHFVLSAWI